MSCAYKRRSGGFTLIELAIVLIITGIVTLSLAEGYRIYLQGQRLAQTQDRFRVIDSTISTFFAIRGRYPCPATPNLPSTNPNAGVENCALVATPGNCVGGMCRVNGRLLNGATNPETILVGAIPYRTLRVAIDTDAAGNAITGAGGNVITNSSFADVAGAEAFDGWGRQIVYAVTESMTNASTYNQVLGALAVQTEAGASLVDPVGSAHLVFISGGENGMGTFTREGTQVAPCVAGTADFQNCNNDGTFLAGLRNMGGGATYFDDLMYFRSMTVTSLWQVVNDPTVTPPSIYNTNPRNVGIGTATPVEKLDVVRTAGNGALKAQATSSSLLCDTTGVAGGNCFPASALGGTGSKCESQPGDPANSIRLMTGIVNDVVTCSPPVPLPSSITASPCPTGQFMVGFTLYGQLVCDTP